MVQIRNQTMPEAAVNEFTMAWTIEDKPEWTKKTLQMRSAIQNELTAAAFGSQYNQDTFAAHPGLNGLILLVSVLVVFQHQQLWSKMTAAYCD